MLVTYMSYTVGGQGFGIFFASQELRSDLGAEMRKPPSDVVIWDFPSDSQTKSKPDDPEFLRSLTSGSGL